MRRLCKFVGGPVFDLRWLQVGHLPKAFALTAVSIARHVGIVTTPPNQLQHFGDLDRKLALESISEYDADKPEDAKPKSLVLSGLELMVMNEAQWKQALAVSWFLFVCSFD